MRTQAAVLCFGVPPLVCIWTAGFLLFCSIIVKESNTALIFTFNDFEYFFRAFLAVVFQPQFYDLCNARLEKFHVILNESVLKMRPGKGGVIADDSVLIIISELEIGLVEDLVLIDMTEQLQIIMAVKALCDFIFVQI